MNTLKRFVFSSFCLLFTICCFAQNTTIQIEELLEHNTSTISNVPIPDFSFNIAEGCSPLQVSFQDETTGEVESRVWSFPGGTPSVSTEASPVILYTSSGTYDVILEVFNSEGSAIETKTGAITVLKKPTAGFLVNNVLGSSRVLFENRSNGADRYEWDFGDGTISTEISPEHQYQEGGTYTVTLFSYNDCGSDIFTTTVNIITEVSADFTADRIAACSPVVVSFYDGSSGNVEEWEWIFEGGSPNYAVDANPTIVYEESGSYDVVLIVKNSISQDTIVRTNYIKVLPEPVADFDLSYTVSGIEVEFTNLSENATTYLWDFGDGNTSMEESPVHTYEDVGTYRIDLLIGSACGQDSISKKVSLLGIPIGDFEITNNGSCAPFEASFIDRSQNGVAGWLWTFEGGYPSTSYEPNPRVIYEKPGTYNVQLIVRNGLGRDTIIKENFVDAVKLPVSDFSFEREDNTVKFTNLTDRADQFYWTFGDGATSTAKNPTYTYTHGGEYIVQMSASNICGSNLAEKNISVEGSLPIQFSSSINEACAPVNVQFFNNTAIELDSFVWIFPDAEPRESRELNPIVSYATRGEYLVSLKGYLNGQEEIYTQSDFIEVLETPVPWFEYYIIGGKVIFDNQTLELADFEWDFGDGNTSTEPQPEHSYDESGRYEVTLTATNECGTRSFSASFRVFVIVSNTESLEWVEDFKVFPNPFNDQLQLYLSGIPRSGLRLSLFDVLGRTVLLEEQSFKQGVIDTDIDVSQLSKGVYWLKIEDENTYFVHKIIKQ